MTPETAFLIGSGIGGLGSLAGGSSEGRAKRNLRTQYKYQQRYGPAVQSALFDAKMASAQKYNIHPLAALGVPMAQAQPVTPIQDDSDNRKAAALASMGQAIGSALVTPEAAVPSGVVTYKDGNPWPHYYDKKGNARPYSAQQFQNLMTLETHRAQMSLLSTEKHYMEAQIAEIQGQNQNAPEGMFTMLKTPFGPMPFPNQILGEVKEALEDPMIRGMWMDYLGKNYPHILKAAKESAKAGIGTMVGSEINTLQDGFTEAWQMFKVWINQEQ